jgi:hypothetical protein
MVVALLQLVMLRAKNNVDFGTCTSGAVALLHARPILTLALALPLTVVAASTAAAAAASAATKQQNSSRNNLAAARNVTNPALMQPVTLHTRPKTSALALPLALVTLQQLQEVG